MPSFKIHHAKSPTKPHAIFISAGNRETFASFAVEKLSTDFDILIFYYGKDEEKQRALAAKSNLFASGIGTKFQTLKDIVSSERGLFAGYETVWVCDDDIVPEYGDLRSLPSLVRYFNIKALSPVHSRTGKISHKIMLPKLGAHIFRYVSYIEMTCPLFSTEALFEFLDSYDGSLEGYGCDWWFLNIFKADRQPTVALVDIVAVINPADVAKPGQYREIETVSSTANRREQWVLARQNYGLKQWAHRTLFYVYSARRVDGDAVMGIRSRTLSSQLMVLAKGSRLGRKIRRVLERIV